MVEYIGMKNLINAVKEGVGLRTGKLIYGFEGILFHRKTLIILHAHSWNINFRKTKVNKI